MEAAYSTILRKHRRSLHRKVQELLAEDLHLDGGGSPAVQADHNADVQEQLAYHWRCILGKVETWKAAAAERDISPRDLRSGSSAYRWLGKHYVDNGLVRDASVNLVRLPPSNGLLVYAVPLYLPCRDVICRGRYDIPVP